VLQFDRNMYINLAAFVPVTRVLGPGLRAGIWVQGCPFHCAGCIAPGWIPQQIAELTSFSQLAERILAVKDITGVTISGGEPMLQAFGLAEMLKIVKQSNPINVITFTGFTLEQLRAKPPNPGIDPFLSEIDVLIDGLYQAELNNDIGLRGSSNQHIHYLSDSLVDAHLETYVRQAEIFVQNGELFIAGVPSRNFADAISSALDQFESPGELE
jgi:anaerobic ribonucleoside-triphosphate reductase activating protein